MERAGDEESIWEKDRVWIWKNRPESRNIFGRKAVGHVLLIWHPATNLTAFGEEEEMKGAVTDCLCKAASNQHHALLMTLMASVLITRLWTASGHVTGDHTWSAQARRLTVHKHFLYTSSSPPLTLHPTSLPSLSPLRRKSLKWCTKESSSKESEWTLVAFRYFHLVHHHRVGRYWNPEMKSSGMRF